VIEVVLFQKNHSASDSVISYLSSVSRLLNFVAIVPTILNSQTYRPTYNNFSMSLNHFYMIRPKGHPNTLICSSVPDSRVIQVR
jgi:hypothetical protein